MICLKSGIARKMEKEIECFIHDHPLILRDHTQQVKKVKYCSVCELPISSTPMYDCNQCKDFVIHKSCAELPEHMEHPFHPQHPLTLFFKSPYESGTCYCDACGKRCASGFIFHCEECKFDLDVGCTSLLPTMSYEGHPHPLVFFEKIYEYRRCGFCGFDSNASVFQCVECEYTIHKSCVELPKQIKHPFHPFHPLTPFNAGFYCAACKGGGYTYTAAAGFCCKECEFNLHEKCASLQPTIRYEGHEHPLTPFELIAGKYNWCDSCDASCDGFVFRCVECDFNLHPQCFPCLPHTVKHKCHIDPLILTENVFEEGDDPDELYCDACEEKRNPEHPVYYCEECKFIAHICCVMDEVLPLIITEQERNPKPPNVGIKVAQIDKDIATLRVEVEEMELEVAAETIKINAKKLKLGVMKVELKATTTKLEVLESRRAEFATQIKMLSARDEGLSLPPSTNEKT